MTADCGGCQGQGAHRRWCKESVGFSAAQWGPLSEALEAMGDRIGSNQFEAANHCYAAAGLMRKKAEVERAVFQSQQKTLTKGGGDGASLRRVHVASR